MKHLVIFLLFLNLALYAQEDHKVYTSSTFNGMELRNIGPAFTSGRIADVAIHPDDENCWYVAVGSGGVWKTVNAGTTWTPIFDSEGSYSIGCLALDPGNPYTVWVGTGENVGGRHVAYGDGVYRSLDGGKTWKHMGLKQSEHISKIIVHPHNPDRIWVASQGPLWSPGGERGLFLSTDGGENWKKVLGDNEWTGVTDVVMDPRNPDLLYAATWQRHRTVAAYLGGGPGSGIHRSRDGGVTWEKLSKGLPSSRLGKIGLAISPFNPDVVYAAVETDRRSGGVYMSVDAGSSWTKQSGAVSGATGPHYYQELYACPHHEGRLYLVDASMQISDDHGKTFRRMNQQGSHSDNHSVSFKKDDPDYVMIGTDGGLYESFDGTRTWRFIANLPVTQYYKVAVDDSEPFYYIYGGTQDNGSHGGPSRTDNRHGIRNADWFYILGGDGHQPATEPGNPDIVYAESQQGYMNRIDRSTGETVPIQPQPGKGEPFERFNWDTPILVSPHKASRIYTGSYRVWRSENRGDSWTPISGELTRQQERQALPIMGRVQSWDNAWDHYAMSTYNTISSLAESPLQEGLLYAGTDDGIIQVSEDGGQNWRKTEVGSIRGIPPTAFVNDIRADLFDAQTVYAALDNHKYGDYQPYLVKSTDAGASWTSIAGNLPDRTLIWRLVQDHVNRDLLFVATEFGIYFTTDGGQEWLQLKGGLPTISFRDITIQRRENDLVAASFGRGFFILDDLSPLREVSPEKLQKEAILFPVKDAWYFQPRYIVGSQGASQYSAENPPHGAVISYYLKDAPLSLKAERRKAEKEIPEEENIPFPGWEALDREKAQEDSYLLFTIRDEAGEIVNHVKAPAVKGIHRATWGFDRMPASTLIAEGKNEAPEPGRGFSAGPGQYSVSMALVSEGEMKSLSGPQDFKVKALRKGTLGTASGDELKAYQAELQSFRNDLSAASRSLSRLGEEMGSIKKAALRAEKDLPELLTRIYQVDAELRELDKKVNGSPSKNEVGEKQSPTPRTRMSAAYGGVSSDYGPTELHRQSLELGVEELKPILEKILRYEKEVIPGLKEALKAAGAPEIVR